MDTVPFSGPTARRWAPPPWGDSSAVLALINFFAGGAAIWVAATVSLVGMWTEYDGLAMIGMLVLPVLVAVPSALAAFVIGLPIRLIPAARRWWLAHGGYTMIGAAAGFVVLLLGVVLMRMSVEGEGWQILLVGWGVFCLSTMHVVWPRRWSGQSEPPPRLYTSGVSPAAAPAPPARMPRRR